MSVSLKQEALAEQPNLSQKELIRAAYGENRPVTGEYDSSLSVRCFNGTFVGKEEDDILSFKGIPFAQSPTGERRWKLPAPVVADDGVYEAYYNGKSQIQTELDTERASFYPQGEDCLYLNIWLNRSCDIKDKTVMVFFHGGSYGWGGTADPLYDGTNFVKAHPDIIMVTAAYRIGLMGFVDFSSLKGGEEFPDAPNLGIYDQLESLRWVQKNIASFGGNPDNVTIFGESAGAGSVSVLSIVPQAKGLFRRMIAQSGSIALTFSKKECAAFTEKLVKESGIKSMDELMKLSEAQLQTLNEKLNPYNNFPQRDGKLIPIKPYEPFEEGKSSDIDMLIGTNADESRYWIGEVGGIVPYRFTIPIKFESDMKALTKKDRKRVDLFMSSLSGHRIWRMSEFYDELMFRLPAICQTQLHAKNGGRAYMYYWTEPSVIRYYGACHAVELSYVFGNTEETIYTGRTADKALSSQVMEMWANFARTGDPSVENLTWPQYDGEKRLTMVLSRDSHVESDILSKQRILLFPLLRYMISTSYTSLDMNVPFVRKTLSVAAASVAAIAAGGILLYLLLSDD